MQSSHIEIGKTTVADLVDIMADQFGTCVALEYHCLGIKHDFNEFRRICDNVAKGLMALGIKKGEHIAIWANNIPEWVYLQYGSARMGAVLVTVNTSYRNFELEYLLKQSDTTTLFMVGGVREPDEYIKIVSDVCPEIKNSDPGKLESAKLPKLKNLIHMGKEKQSGMFNLEEVIKVGEKISDDKLKERIESLEPDDVINMQYTSGTTGFPKGVMLSHSNLIGNAYSASECLGVSPQDCVGIPVPFFHCFGCVIGTLLCMVSGAKMAPVAIFSGKNVLEMIQASKCTVILGVPTMFIAELEEMENTKYDTSSLRTGIMAGSPCPVEIMKAVITRMGVKEITIAFGQTEASPVITQTRTTDSIERRVNTVGRALPNVEVKIVDPLTNHELQPGMQGELCCRGYNVMTGYYKNPGATENAIDTNNWLHTGDLAIMDKDGYCKITGRIKDMIIRGGENIYPREIEEFLYTNPKIKDVQVVGLPSEKYGEEIVAFVQLKTGQKADKAELKEFCKNKIAFHKIPAFFMFSDEYPTTASGKVQKFKLREKAIKKIGRETAKNIKTA